MKYRPLCRAARVIAALPSYPVAFVAVVLLRGAEASRFNREFFRAALGEGGERRVTPEERARAIERLRAMKPAPPEPDYSEGGE